ncbi:subtilisin-like protease SBT2.4 [Iris pallida]|uniref:Subtilisin-like protease SBT2.4 n=1 Tax=Iris pallida TaxID=29817 RepID=A0AAX6G3N9_IRIPA|nr:subtilisin-like protease SBT2.4 [Iris pallida]
MRRSYRLNTLLLTLQQLVLWMFQTCHPLMSSHVASIATGNWGVHVVVDGFYYGRASGMVPRAKLAIYKALYPEGCTFVDVLFVVDQTC